MKFYFYFFVSSFFGFSSFTVPSAFSSKCQALDFINDTSSTVLRDHENCSIGWILPPSFGAVKLSGFTSSANLTLCQELKDVQGMSSDLIRRMRQIPDQMKAMNGKYEKLEEEFIIVKKNLLEIERSYEYREIANLEEQLFRIERRTEKLLDELIRCDKGCELIKEEITIKREEKIELKDALFEMKDLFFDLVRDHRKQKAEHDSLEHALGSVEKIIRKKQESYLNLKAVLQRWVAYYAKLEGGYAHLNYNTGWVENVQYLNKKYGNKYLFKSIPTRNARISANFIGAADKESYLSSMPAILDYVVSGTKFTPWGNQGVVEHSSLPSHLAGTIRLSLIGACPMYYSNFIEAKELVRNEDLPQKLNFSISATYEYPAAFKYKVSASYNLFRIYEKIVESSSEGGFFSTAHYKNMVENEHDSEQFSIHWFQEDETFNDEQKGKIRKALKAELIGRVLNMMASPIYSKAAGNLSASTPISTENGAVVLAKGVEKTCGFLNLYCAAASWALRGLSSIFGSAENEARFKKISNQRVTETWSALEAKWRPAATGFIGK